MAKRRLLTGSARRGDSIQAVADHAGVSHMTVYRIEPHRVSPTVAVLEKLARALQIEGRDVFRRVSTSRQRRARSAPGRCSG